VDQESTMQHFQALVNAGPLHEVAKLRYQELPMYRICHRPQSYLCTSHESHSQPFLRLYHELQSDAANSIAKWPIRSQGSPGYMRRRFPFGVIWNHHIETRGFWGEVRGVSIPRTFLNPKGAPDWREDIWSPSMFSSPPL
jgi:hypothetical protein